MDKPEVMIETNLALDNSVGYMDNIPRCSSFNTPSDYSRGVPPSINWQRWEVEETYNDIGLKIEALFEKDS